MIISITSDKKSFKKVTFERGMNVVLADTSESSTTKDSRNGLGKSSLIEIIHFCLGSELKEGHGLARPELIDWTFNLEIEINKKIFVVSRNTKSRDFITVKGDTSSWPIKPTYVDKWTVEAISVDDWNKLLGFLFYDLSLFENSKYSPTHRQLLGFFARRGKEAYTRALQYFGKQQGWQTQVLNAFLLNLSWEQAREWQFLKDKDEATKTLKNAIKSGAIESMSGGTLGELENEKVLLEKEVTKERVELENFKVHPQYENIETKCNALTNQIHAISNENIENKLLLGHYQNSMNDEQVDSPQDIETIYNQLGFNFPDQVKKHLKDVQQFHQEVIKNRESYLTNEISLLKNKIAEGAKIVQELSNERATYFEILRTHKALDEYNKLNQKHLALVQRLESIKSKISDLRDINLNSSKLKIEVEQLVMNAKRDYDDREVIRDQAISFFNENSQALYEKPGKLIIDILKSGFKFDIEIQRADSDGVKLMEVFCYDVMLAKLWSKRNKRPDFLIHDSTVFADVDERQIAKALALASESSSQFGFQYICCLNSDKVPWDLLDEKLDLKNKVRLTLKDSPPEACLFGIRF